MGNTKPTNLPAGSNRLLLFGLVAWAVSILAVVYGDLLPMAERPHGCAIWLMWAGWAVGLAYPRRWL